ncbi:hypothetical protein JOB18_011377 [Solea senegalensis]|uniref:Uncharacterized protein n=1 Tax=Solea senegalensis TaxID=28829 RepID=A0AAV6RBW8_SOLSE|nr:hypothetical protein JOB18_011377 [Solea senegalensis]
MGKRALLRNSKQDVGHIHHKPLPATRTHDPQSLSMLAPAPHCNNGSFLKTWVTVILVCESSRNGEQEGARLLLNIQPSLKKSDSEARTIRAPLSHSYTVSSFNTPHRSSRQSEGVAHWFAASE